jgi:hypothetical protein
MSEYPALETGANLSLHKPRDRGALPPRLIQEGLELFADAFVKEGLFGLVAFLSNDGNRPSDQRSSSESKRRAETTMTR